MSTSDHDSEPLETAQQVEQQFNYAWRSAAESPEAATLRELWQLVEPHLSQFSDAEQLRLVASVIEHLAELHTLKAERLLADWQDHYNDEGPVIDMDFLQNLVQKTMYLDLTGLVKPKAVRDKKVNPSVVGHVDKKKVLQMVDSIESEQLAKQQALAVAHDENVSVWIEIINQWMQQQSKQEFTLLELVYSVKLPLIKVWLALLLGNYELESKGEFYAIEQIWVYAKG